MPRVSVIIPTYRRPQLLAAAIESVLAQTYQDFEILVVDDASGDNTEAVVRGIRDARVHYLAHRTNWRIAAARNTGVLSSQGELIAFLDDDDEWLPTKLERQVAVFDRCAPVTGAVYTGFVKIDRSSGGTLATVKPTKAGHILHELCQKNCVGTASTVILRRACLEEVGLFDETVEFGEEYDMWIRVAHAFDFRCIDEPLVRYSVHGKRMSTNYWTMIAGLERQIVKHGKLFATVPRALSRRYVTLGALYCYVGETSKARAAFVRAISIAPAVVKYYGYLGLSLFGSAVFSRLRRPDPRTL